MTTLADDKKPKVDKPPKGQKGKPSPLTPTQARQIRDSLTSLITVLGVSISTRDVYCGNTIVAGGPAFVDSWIALARQNPAVKRALLTLSSTSAWAGVISSTAAILIPVAAHHGVLPANVAQQILLNTTPDGESNLGEPPSPA